MGLRSCDVQVSPLVWRLLHCFNVVLREGDLFAQLACPLLQLNYNLQRQIRLVNTFPSQPILQQPSWAPSHGSPCEDSTWSHGHLLIQRRPLRKKSVMLSPGLFEGRVTQQTDDIQPSGAGSCFFKLLHYSYISLLLSLDVLSSFSTCAATATATAVPARTTAHTTATPRVAPLDLQVA